MSDRAITTQMSSQLDPTLIIKCSTKLQERDNNKKEGANNFTIIKTLIQPTTQVLKPIAVY